MERFLNFNLMRSPVNWAIVFLMVTLAGSLLVMIVPEDNQT
jgi:hypothetical protein